MGTLRTVPVLARSVPHPRVGGIRSLPLCSCLQMLAVYITPRMHGRSTQPALQPRQSPTATFAFLLPLPSTLIAATASPRGPLPSRIQFRSPPVVLLPPPCTLRHGRAVGLGWAKGTAVPLVARHRGRSLTLLPPGAVTNLCRDDSRHTGTPSYASCCGRRLHSPASYQPLRPPDASTAHAPRPPLHLASSIPIRTASQHKPERAPSLKPRIVSGPQSCPVEPIAAASCSHALITSLTWSCCMIIPRASNQQPHAQILSHIQGPPHPIRN